MIDLHHLQQDKGGDPELVRASQRQRNAPVELVDQTIQAYRDWTAAQFELEKARKEVNTVQKEITTRKKAKQDAEDLVLRKKELDAAVERLRPSVAAAEEAMRAKASRIGNLVHPDVPVSTTEDENAVIRTWHPDGPNASLQKEGAPAPRSHHDILAKVNGYDPNRGQKVAGHRGYFLTDVGVDLNLALVRYGLDFLAARPKPFTKVQTPFFMRRELMAKTAQLEEFDEALYKLQDAEKTEEIDEKYLIATSEQPLSAMHAGELFDKPAEQLPIRYAGYSTCFRKEAGSHGKETWGIFRIHQFEKIEQFCITEPQASMEQFNDMVENAELFYQSLKLPYRLVAIVSGALNNAAAIKYDLEAWFPFQKEYKELVSCSNCTDYQSRSLGVKCGAKKPGETRQTFVHMLNGTLCATERAICCILENYQTETGLVVPEVLRPYMQGRDFIPYA